MLGQLDVEASIRLEQLQCMPLVIIFDSPDTCTLLPYHLGIYPNVSTIKKKEAKYVKAVIVLFFFNDWFLT